MYSLLNFFYLYIAAHSSYDSQLNWIQVPSRLSLIQRTYFRKWPRERGNETWTRPWLVARECLTITIHLHGLFCHVNSRSSKHLNAYARTLRLYRLFDVPFDNMLIVNDCSCETRPAYPRATSSLARCVSRHEVGSLFLSCAVLHSLLRRVLKTGIRFFDVI